MKKNLIKQAKKSLSLFMAVIMLMSCWVWLAPEEAKKAEAANVDLKTGYEVEVVFWIRNNNGTTQFSGGHVKYRTAADGGWGAVKEHILINSLKNDKYTDGKTYIRAKRDSDKDANGEATANTNFKLTFTTTEFPVEFEFSTDGGDALISSNDCRIECNSIKINGKYVFRGAMGHNKDNVTYVRPDYNADDFGTSGGDGGDTFSWPRPHIYGFLDSSATADDININPLDTIDGKSITKSTYFDPAKYTCYDQYGVKASDYIVNNGKYCQASQTTYVAGTKNSDDTITGAAADDIFAVGDGYDSVTVKPGLQVSNPKSSNGEATYYLVRRYVCTDSWGGEAVSKVSSKINIKYPQYTVNFIAGLNADLEDASGSLGIGKYSQKNYNGGAIRVPTVAEADGNTFYGFWSKPQPTFTDANLYALEAIFAKPCSTADYNAYAAEGTAQKFTYTETVDGKEIKHRIVVRANGSKWYDAGLALEPLTAKTIDVSGNLDTTTTDDDFVENWYGWWCADDLNVKFFDVDGAYIGEKVVKYGQNHSAVKFTADELYFDKNNDNKNDGWEVANGWPVSRYTTYTSGAVTFTVEPYIWEDIDGTTEVKYNSHTFTKDLILTPTFSKKEFTSTYDVSFINPDNGNSIDIDDGEQNGTYNYRQNIIEYANEAQTKLPATPADVVNDLQYSYELLGWSSVVPTTGKNYHVLEEEADFDVNGKAIGISSDWIVRGEAEYYAVYRRHTKTYVVDFRYRDTTGNLTTEQVRVKYGEELKTPVSVVPYKYVVSGWGNEFKEWSFTAPAGADNTAEYDDSIIFTKENINILPAAFEGSTNLSPITIAASYYPAVSADYTVTFNYIDAEGKDYSTGFPVKNRNTIPLDKVNALQPAETWDDGENQRTYANAWKIVEGTATVGVGGEKKVAGEIIKTEDLAALAPTSNITFKAEYINPQPFYTVTYVDGTNTESFRVLKDSNVPVWTFKDGQGMDNVYTPADYAGDGGTYKFQGWYDQKQTDETFSTTNGNKITAANTVSGNLTLYSQFRFVADKFLIRFMNHDGSVQIGGGEFVKGQNIEYFVTEATKAAQTREADETYTYQFLGWDKPVPTFCEGYSVTYIAQYKPIYRYYDVKWYNSVLVDGKWAANEDLLTTTHHTYNSRLYTPAIDSFECPVAAPDGQSYVFAGWYYNDAEGNAVKYERGMAVTAEMDFYATYTLTDKVYTVTTVVKGENTRYTVAANSVIKENIPDPKAGYVDAVYEPAEGGAYDLVDGKYVKVEDGTGAYNLIKASCHDAFVGWYTDAEFKTTFDATAAITTDTTLYAKFAESDHNYSEKALKTAPTYYEAGEMEVWCSCNQALTKKIEPIDMLTDTKLPTGTIYLGDKSWSSTDEVGANATDDTEKYPISIFVNADTDVIITSNDTGDVNELYNPSGLGIGVKYIRAFAFPAETVLTAENYGAAQELAMYVYSDETQDATNNANFSVKLGDFIIADLDENGGVQYVEDEDGAYDLVDGEYVKAADGDGDYSIKYKNLESGEAYIIYYYVNDKATTANGAPATGNQLNRKVRTAKFIYDNTAPVFTVEGTSNEAIIPTYCAKATVTGLEKDVVLTVNGEVVAVSYAEGAETGTYEIVYDKNVDNVIITATDKAGNSISKKIKVADHSYLVEEKASTCTEDGYKREVCIVCDYVKTNKTYTSTGHTMGMPGVVPPTCTEDGYEVTKCEDCDYEIVTTREDLEARGHAYNKDDEGNTIYTIVTEATCQNEGLEVAICTVCGEKDERAIGINPENHKDITATEVKPDCISDGSYKEVCACGEVIKTVTAEDDEKYAAKGHGTIEAGTAKWIVRTEPTCYQEGEKVLQCLECNNLVKDENGEEVTAVIEPTGEHVKVVANPDTYKDEGVVKYECATAECPHKYEDKIIVDETLEEYTITFLSEDGKTQIAKITVVEGTHIEKGAVTPPEKAATLEYTYSFAGWVDAEGKTYKLPLEVTKSMTLKASYSATKILYTRNFQVPTTCEVSTGTKVDVSFGGYVNYTTLIGGYGEERVPSSNPVFVANDAELNKRVKFEFDYWVDASNKKVESFEISESGTLKAVFKAELVEYDVIFYNGNDLAGTAKVSAGSAATFEGDTPEKKPDATNHYTFNAWYTDAECNTLYANAPITEKTRLYAGFTATAHTLEVVLKDDKGNDLTWAATCTEAGQTTKKCACGYTETTVVDALGHDFTTGKIAQEDIKLEDGTVIKAGSSLCENYDTCGGYVLPEVLKVTVTFNEKVTYTVDEVTTILSEGKIAEKEVEENGKYDYTAPKKESSAEYEYTFVNWTDAEGKEVSKVEKLELTDVAEAATYTANYTAAKRKYTVSYIVDIESRTPIKTYVLEYGATVPAAPADPTKAWNVNDHFTFVEWKYEEGTAGTVTGETVIVAQFKQEAHDWVETDKSANATCEEAGGKIWECACGATQAGGGDPATGHKFKIVVESESYEATYEAPGRLVKKCENCEKTEITELPQRQYQYINVTVKDSKGNPVEDAEVKLYRDGQWIDTNFSNTAGKVTFRVGDEDYKYTVLISGVEGLEKTEYEVSGGGSVETVFGESDNTNSCGCSCHRAGFWGIVFRFFHKVISWFTGRIICCSCPDEAY